MCADRRLVTAMTEHGPTASGLWGTARLWALAGAVCGFFLWAYDYDFFLNAGGPETPISNAILAYTRAQHADVFVLVLEPLAVLVGVGALLGLALARIFLHRTSN
jgi:hypothetical protein